MTVINLASYRAQRELAGFDGALRAVLLAMINDPVVMQTVIPSQHDTQPARDALSCGGGRTSGES